jgi:hypothetical protein
MRLAMAVLLLSAVLLRRGRSLLVRGGWRRSERSQNGRGAEGVSNFHCAQALR